MYPPPWRFCDHATSMTQVMPSQRLDAKLIWYTDGSKQVRDYGAILIEALVFNAERESSHTVNPRGLLSSPSCACAAEDPQHQGLESFNGAQGGRQACPT